MTGRALFSAVLVAGALATRDRRRLPTQRRRGIRCPNDQHRLVPVLQLGPDHGAGGGT